MIMKNKQTIVDKNNPKQQLRPWKAFWFLVAIKNSCYKHE